MCDLIQKYKEECDISSKLANRIWKISHFVIYFVSFFILICLILHRKYILAFLSSFLFVVLSLCLVSYVCMRIDNKVIAQKLNFVNIARKYDIKIVSLYKKLDLYQKKWILNYCELHNINSINKLKIIRDELKDIRLKESKKVVAWDFTVIISSVVANIITQVLLNGGIYLDFVVIVLIILSFVLLELCSRQFQAFLKNKDYFNKCLGYDRLDYLLLDCILKCEK